ncbi:MAG TPA: DUF4412 domain-containing protein [Puia sp.]|nr:DUF4412 domain-containing protein [Puia sp.]
MKTLLTFLLVTAAGSAFAQFNGKLVYQIDQQGSRTVMTYVQNGTNAIVTAYTIKLTNGVTDTTTFHAQDTIIFDFAAATETHLQYRTMNAYKQKYMGTLMAGAMKNQGAVTAAAAGSASVNGYNCNHYVITTKSALGISTKDIYTTGDIGGSPTLWVVGAFTYYTPGYPHFVKLMAAGASGVVVQASSSNNKQGLLVTMNLVSADTKFVPRARGYFSVPSRYNLIDETNMTLPGSGN